MLDILPVNIEKEGSADSAKELTIFGTIVKTRTKHAKFIYVKCSQTCELHLKLGQVHENKTLGDRPGTLTLNPLAMISVQ